MYLLFLSESPFLILLAFVVPGGDVLGIKTC